MSNMEFPINEGNFEHDPLSWLYLMQGNSQSIQAVSEASLNNRELVTQNEGQILENYTLIQDTSLGQSTANNPEVEELQSLLASWSQTHLLEFFVGMYCMYIM